MKQNGRDNRGRFAPGNGGGPGRPRREIEEGYLQTLSTTCTLDDWQDICRRAVQDAKAGDHRAREWLTKYLVGAGVPDLAQGNSMRPWADEVNDFANAPSELVHAAMAAMEDLRMASAKASGNAYTGWSFPGTSPG